MNFASKKAIDFITDLNLPNEAIVDKPKRNYYLLTDLLDKFLNQKAKESSIKEIEFRINKCKEICNNRNSNGDPLRSIDEIDSLLFDIQDFINDLKE